MFSRIYDTMPFQRICSELNCQSSDLSADLIAFIYFYVSRPVHLYSFSLNPEAQYASTHLYPLSIPYVSL